MSHTLTLHLPKAFQSLHVGYFADHPMFRPENALPEQEHSQNRV